VVKSFSNKQLNEEEGYLTDTDDISDSEEEKIPQNEEEMENERNLKLKKFPSLKLKATLSVIKMNSETIFKNEKD
jgi:hypothetical protein